MKRNKKIIQNSSKLLLKELEISDVNQKYVSWLNDPEVNQYLESRFTLQNENLVKSFVERVWNSEVDFLFGIYLDNGIKHIGNIKIGPINLDHNSASIGLLIGDKNHWGKGYASIAISMITEFAFSDLKLSKLSAGCYSENIGSKQAFEKSGYKVEGFLREHVETGSGRSGIWKLGCLKSDFF